MNQNLNKYIFSTPNIYNDEEAVELKMKQIHPKLFGLFCPVRYECIKKEKVYVPYMLLVFNYKITRSSAKADKGKKGIFDRSGKIGIVFDMNEVHAFHFDLLDKLEFDKTNTGRLDGRILKGNCSQSEAVKQGEECIKSQYLGRVFHQIPELTLDKKVMFYREAWELQLECRGKSYQKYAYKDNFGAKNEHISGLKVRLTV